MGKMPRKFSLYGVVLAILLFVIFQMSSVPIQAETQSPQADVDQEVSAFSNPAQAAHAANLAAAAAVTVGEIADMRSEDLGWGQIAHALGVHPGVLGLGHTKGKNAQSTSEIQMATARDMQTGLAKGHGARTDSGSGERGLGLGHAASGHSAKDGSSVGSHGLGNAGGHAGHGGGSGGGQGGGSGGGHGAK